MTTNDHFVLRQSCPACGCRSSRELYSAAFTAPPLSTYLESFYARQGGVDLEYLKGARFVLDRCADCDLVYQRMAPDDFLTAKLYEEWIDPGLALRERLETRTAEHYVQLSREIERFLWHFGTEPSKLAVLDFGMGWGEWCRMAAAYGCVAFGVELSPSRADRARGFGVTTVDRAGLSKHEFQFINAEQVFEHLAEPLEVLRDLSGSLAPGGLVRISVPNGWDIGRRLSIMDWTAPKGSRDSLNPVAPLEHLNCFSEKALVRMAREARLEPTQVRARPLAGRPVPDLTLRELLTPLYRRLFPSGRTPPGGSTTLYFRRAEGG